MSPPTAAPATSNGAAASGGSDENNKHTGSKPPTSPSASGGAGGGGAGLPRPAGVVRSATAAGQPPSASGTAASGAASSTGAGAGAGHGGGHGGHRRVYSAVEGSLAQQALLEGTAGLVLGGNLDLSGMSLSDASNAGNAGVGVGSSGGNGSGGGDKQDDKDATTGAAASAADVTSWNELAQTQGELLKSDHEQQARQEEEAAVFAQEALGEASAEEDVEVISSPKAAGAGGAGGSGGIGTPTRGANYHPEATPDDELSTPKTVGGTLVPLDADGRLLLDRADGIPTPGLPPLSSSSSVQPSSRVPYGAAAGGGGGGMSVTSSTRSIPGSLVRPSGIDTAAGTIGGATAAASRAYSDIIEDEKADHRDTEDLEGLSIGYDGSMMEDDDNNSIISGVTTWMPLADAVGGGGIGGGGDDNRSIKSGASRKGGGKRGKRLDDVDETSRSPPSAAAVARAAAVAAANASAHASSNAGGIGGGGALPSALLRRSSAASSKDGGESGYVSSASGGAVSNDAFLQAMRAGAGAGTGTGGASAHHRVTASSVTDRTSGGGSARKSALRHHHHHQQQPHHPHGRAHSPSARDTQSPLSLDELPVTPTRTGGSIQGSLSNLGTAGGGGGVGAAPLAAAPVSSTAAAAGTGGGTSDLLLNAINDLRGHVDRTLDGVRDQNRSDFEKVLAIMQNESSKRSALESRLHAQLLLQSEAMVAMEMKLLRLEAKVEGKGKQDQHAHHHQQHQHRAGSGIGGGSSSAGPPVSVLRESGFATGGPIVSSLPPISSERPYEEDDLGSLEDGGVPRAVRASRAFAASGASLASAVTDGFTVDDASTKSERDESTAQGEDGGDVSVDGSDSSKFSVDWCFCAYNASVGSYLSFVYRIYLVFADAVSNLIFVFPLTLPPIAYCIQLPRPLAQDTELLIPFSWIQRSEETSAFMALRLGRHGVVTMGTVIRL